MNDEIQNRRYRRSQISNLKSGIVNPPFHSSFVIWISSFPSEVPHVTAPILSHVFPNGLVLLAQPMHWLQSAAFSFLVPAGCVNEPAARLGLASFTCEMTLRGAGPRDNRQFVLDLDNLGVEHHASVSSARASYGGATLAENLPAALAIFADVLRRPRLPAEELEACRQNLLQSLRSVEDEPSEKVMIELRRRHFPDPWGRSSLGEQEALETIDLEEIRGFFSGSSSPTARSSAWPAAWNGSR